MGRYLLMGDIHLSDRPPSSCTDSYNDDIFQLLEHTVHIARSRDVSAVIWAGDIFHHKTPGRTSHQTVRRAIELVASYPCQVWVVAGNHDLSNDRLESIEDGQPLGVMVTAQAVGLLDGWMFSGAEPVYGVPWLGRFTDDTVNAALADYRHADPEDAHFLVVTHAPLYPPGRELPYEHYTANCWSSAMGHSGSVYYGHVHEAHGIYTVDGVTYCNPGALSRGSLHEHNLTRRIQVALWDDETGEFELIDVPHKPADEVFRLAQIGEIKTAQLALDGFLASVGETRLEITSTEAVIAHIRSLGVGADLETVLIELLDHAG